MSGSSMRGSAPEGDGSDRWGLRSLLLARASMSYVSNAATVCSSKSQSIEK